MVRPALVVALVLAGCGAPEPPEGFGVNLTVDASGLAGEVRAQVTRLRLQVPADQGFDRRLDVRAQIGTGEVRFRYRPGLESGAVVFIVDAEDEDQVVLAHAQSDEVLLEPGRALPLTLRLGDAPPDMLPPDDLGPSRAAGQPCTSAAQCGSGFCADGVCCDSACDGACVACNLEGRAGTCSPAPTGASPAPGHASCGPDAEAGCQRDGTCDGRGGCRFWPLGTVCKPARCDAATNQLTPESTCDGKGACVEPQAITCAPYLCRDAQSCYPSCTQTSGQCAGAYACQNGSCGLKALGASCQGGADCESGHCADGVCCNEACAGTCRTCALPMARGTCSTTPARQDPRSQCPAGTGSKAVCTPGGCDGTKPSCAVEPAITACRTASCDGTSHVATGAATCDGSGACPPPQTIACAPYTCGASACKASCATAGDCAPGHLCQGAVCVKKKALGEACGAAAECVSGFCADGVCCNAACDRACEACNAGGSCVAVSGAPRAGHPTCVNQGQTPCGGSCNGTSRDCAYPTVECGAPPSCGCTEFGGVEPFCSVTNRRFCSNGSCPPITTTRCNGYRCAASGTACSTTCDDNPDCIGRYQCVKKITGNFCEPY